MKNISRKYGFTLIELLVVIVIIAVLSAVAWPQYKHAVLKSRFSTVMPMAKAVADAQEIYYLGRGYYAQENEKEELDIKPVTGEDATVSLSQVEGYDYVLAQHAKVPGAHYVMYQTHSENYPGEIHCEAEEENTAALKLCQSVGGTQNIGKTITAGYTTYIIDGTGAGVAPGTFEQAEEAANPMSCDKAIAMGYMCTSDETTGVKKICTNFGVCRTKTYNEDGSSTSVTCQVNSNGVCTSSWKSATYDVNGNRLNQRTCNSVDSSGNCTAYSAGFDYTYDTNGNLLTQRQCKTVNSNGNCTAYSAGYDYTYDTNGNQLTRRQCKTVNSNGNCTAYEYGGTSDSYDYTYDANGNMLSQRNCSMIDANGNCTAYGFSHEYMYDANGNKLTQRRCSSGGGNMDSSGNCTAYSNYGFSYTYDANGNQLTERECGSFDSNGNCTSYLTSSYDYAYDANGNQVTRRRCSSVDSSGNCTAYSSAAYYVYDDNGQQIASHTCSSSNLNTTTGECIAYNSTSMYVYPW